MAHVRPLVTLRPDLFRPTHVPTRTPSQTRLWSDLPRHTRALGTPRLQNWRRITNTHNSVKSSTPTLR